VSFCNGTGRIVTSTGPLVAGLLVGYFGGFTQGASDEGGAHQNKGAAGVLA
jgi:hypothetical protein